MLVQESLLDLDLVRMDHPPYSPDLSPCDFFLFGYVKSQLVNHQYSTPEELQYEVTEILAEIPRDMILRVFDSWMRRLQACIDSGGEFVE